MRHGTLHSLIHSLTPAENRHVKRQLRKMDRVSRYLALFVAIERMKVNDEEWLNAIARELEIHDSLNVTKHLLFKKIMYSLRDLHADRNPDAGLADLIQQAEILLDKKLFDPAEAILQKAETLARESGRHFRLLEILDLRMRLWHLKTDLQSFTVKMPAVYDEKESILREIHFGSALQRISYESFLSLKSGWIKGKSWGSGQLKELKKIQPGLLPTVQLKITWHQVMATILFSRGEPEQAYGYLVEMRRLFHTHEEQIHRSFNQYIALMNNMNLLLVEKGNYSEVMENVRRMRSVQSGNSSQKLRIEERAINAHLAVLRKMRKFNGATEVMKEAEYLLGNRKMTPVYRLLFRFDLFMFSFFRREFQAALRWLQLILRETDESLRPDIRACAVLLEPAVFLELGQTEEAERIIKRLGKDHLRRSDPFSTLMLEVFEGWISVSYGRKSERKISRTEFDSLSSNASLRSKYLSNFPFADWLDDKNCFI